MSLLSYFDSDQLARILRTANYWASYNRNSYPERLDAAISDLYEWIRCPCDSNCECKKHGCEIHLTRKPDIGFDMYWTHFLNCYVDAKAHGKLRSGQATGRASKAIDATDIIGKEWNDKYSKSINKSLICTDWSQSPYMELSQSFRPGAGNIYLSKWMAILSMGTYVAYDTRSVSLLDRDYKKSETYFVVMSRIRDDLLNHLTANNISISGFCLLDNPNEFYRTIPYGNHRPIGDIIDKLYLTL